MEYVWIIFEISQFGQDYIFGVFSSEGLAMEAAKEYDDPEKYRIEKVRLDP